MIFLIGDLRYFCKKIMIRDKTFDFFAIKRRRTDDCKAQKQKEFEPKFTAKLRFFLYKYK